ncbi:MAG: ester cyclase [Chloroflexi bacterium]|nr:ester cyclase [Chloroflexota bacterium]
MDDDSAAARLLDAINTHDLTRVRGVLASDFVYEEVAGPGELSVEALLHELDLVLSAFPDLLLRPVRQTTEGERTYLEFRGMGTHSGEFLSVAPTGATAIVSGVLNVAGGGAGVRRLRMTVDFGGLRRQLLLAARMR